MNNHWFTVCNFGYVEPEVLFNTQKGSELNLIANLIENLTRILMYEFNTSYTCPIIMRYFNWVIIWKMEHVYWVNVLWENGVE